MKSKLITFKLDEETYLILRDRAHTNRCSMASLIRKGIEWVL
jgi:hypothetical protein